MNSTDSELEDWQAEENAHEFWCGVATGVLLGMFSMALIVPILGG